VFVMRVFLCDDLRLVKTVRVVPVNYVNMRQDPRSASQFVGVDLLYVPDV
jgi:hypothetical protein